MSALSGPATSAVRSASSHQRAPLVARSSSGTASASSPSVRVRNQRSVWHSQMPRNVNVAVRDQIHGPSGVSRPTSSRSSRAAACACVSPGSSPPPGAVHTVRPSPGRCAMSSRRSAASSSSTRAASRAIGSSALRPVGSAAERGWAGTSREAMMVAGSTTWRIPPRSTTIQPSSSHDSRRPTRSVGRGPASPSMRERTDTRCPTCAAVTSRR